ncbi:MAG TPA: HAD family hydrolase [Terriglobales bacterium]|nr:HAD family hydrolase [Terriglobales bacterium]
MEIACAAVLFDMDGVLIDSTPAVARVWSQWARERGFDPEKVVRLAHGRPSIATIRDLLPNADHEAENREVERREIADLDGVVPLPGARRLMASLPPERYAIVTSSTRKLAEARLRAAELPVPKFFVTSTDIVNGKPHPEPYLKAAGKLGADPGQCIVVEDVPSGIRSGKAAGARVIAFPTTVEAGELREAGADWVVRNCEDIALVTGAGRPFALELREQPLPATRR